ncbi:MAG: cadherin-like beta sandwich domain-containing protein [Bacilli bacterium]|nr:cadherin-like beta sandwich domain-containing protein [Bacilli bacterium]
MNKKFNPTYVIIGVIFVIAVSIIFLLYSTNKRLEGSVTGPFFGPNIQCNKSSLEIGRSTTCTLNILTESSDNINSLQGKITSSSNITLSNMKINSNWDTVDNTSFDLVLLVSKTLPVRNNLVATFTATANSAGEGYVKLDKLNDQLVVGYDDGADGSIKNIPEVTAALNVVEPSIPVVDDATLKSIKVNDIEVIDDFTIVVDNSVSTADIVVETNDSSATVTGDGQVDLMVGNNSFDITVVSGDESNTQVYTVIIYREPSTDEHMDTLSSLSISPGNLNETFSPEVNSYTATVPYETDSITVNASANDMSSDLSGVGTYPLEVGSNTITVSVTSSTDVINEYTITVTRMEEEAVPKSSDASIRNVKVDGVDLDLETLTTTIEYLNNDYVTIEVTPNDSKAVVTGKIGSQVTRVGENRYDITITAEDETTTNTFTIIVNRKSNETPVDPSDDKDKDPANPDDDKDKEPVNPDDKDEDIINPDTDTDGNNTVCDLKSDVYSVDNINLKIKDIGLNDTSETIEKNISSTCGTIIISNEKVILKYGDITKSYLIERLWNPKTGNTRINYWIIFAIIISLLSLGIIYKVLLQKKLTNNTKKRKKTTKKSK